MKGWKVIIVDNSTGGLAYDDRWKLVQKELLQLDCVKGTGIIPGSITNDYNLIEFHSLSELSKNLAQFIGSGELDNDTILVFPNARDTLALLIHQYRIAEKLQFKMIGFWTDGIYNVDGTIRAKLRGTDYGWSNMLERALVRIFDYNLVSSKALLEKFERYYTKYDRYIVKECCLPFSNIVDEIKHKRAQESWETEKEDLVIMNALPQDYHDTKIFEALEKEFPLYTFINVYDKKMTPEMYYRLLSRAKVVVSTNHTDNNPYSIFIAACLGCIPLLPRIPVYEEMFDDKWLYDKIVLKKPYLNYIRNRHEIQGKIRNFVENYIDYNLENELQRIHDNYFDSKQFQKILCSITN